MSGTGNSARPVRPQSSLGTRLELRLGHHLCRLEWALEVVRVNMVTKRTEWHLVVISQGLYFTLGECLGNKIRKIRRKFCRHRDNNVNSCFLRHAGAYLSTHAINIYACCYIYACVWVYIHMIIAISNLYLLRRS